MLYRCAATGFLSLLLVGASIPAAAPPARPAPPVRLPAPVASATPRVELKAGKLPRTNLEPARLVPEICLLRYRVTTSSPECQAYVD